jgi:tetratricopeptide (TPR) repeat protein
LTTVHDDWPDTSLLSGEAMQGEHFLRRCDQDNLQVLVGLLAYHFGQYTVAESLLIKLVGPFKIIKASFQFYIHHFFASMTYMALYEGNPKKKYLRKARSHKLQLTLRGDDCPDSTPLVKVLAAEELSLALTGDLCE